MEVDLVPPNQDRCSCQAVIANPTFVFFDLNTTAAEEPYLI